MSLTFDTIKIGMRVRCLFIDEYYLRGDKTGVVVHIDGSSYVTVDWDDGFREYRIWSGARYFEEVGAKKRKPRKIIPEIPIDTSLPLLMAGHLQDRQRKKF